MLTPRSIALILVIGTSAGAIATSLRAETVLFEESFLNTTGKGRNIDVSSYEWASFVGEKGELNRANTSVSGAPGNPADTPGFLTASNAPGSSRLLVKNLKPALNLAGATLVFRFGASHAQAQARVVIRVAGRWYASNTVFTSPLTVANGAAFSAAPEAAVRRQFTFSAESSAWRPLTLEPGVALSLSEKRLSTPFPAASASAVGFLLVNTHGSWGVSACFDSLRITAP